MERRLAGDRTVGSEPEVRGIETELVSVAQAGEFFRAKSSELKRAIKNGDRETIQRIVAEHPELMRLPKIKEILAVWMQNGALRGLRGRPTRSGRWPPVFVAAMVDFLISTGKAANKERGFAQLSYFGIGYDTAKRLDAQARSELRFQALLVAEENLARPLDAETYRQISQAERLLPGSTVVQHIDEPALDAQIRVEFTAEAGTPPAGKSSRSERRSKKPLPP